VTYGCLRVTSAREPVSVGLPIGHAVRPLGGYVVAWIDEYAAM